MKYSKQGQPGLVPTISSDRYQAYDVWDAPTRWFHWINALAVLGLIIIGAILLNDDALGISITGKILLKEVHVVLGYVMGLNLIWRFVWAFFGNRYARWTAILPIGTSFWGKLRSYGNAFLSGEPQEYIGHNPAARVAIAALFLLLVLQIATGVVLAGTDLFWPPLGGWFAGWVAATGIDPATVSPLASNTLDQTAYRAMRSFRGPVVMIHLYAFYVLAAVIVMHLIAVIVTEIHEGGSITSAMFTGRKLLNRPPQDL
jgi:Ni/Fe-hydrogenase 1 B-type cytochrome subunit